MFPDSLFEVRETSEGISDQQKLLQSVLAEEDENENEFEGEPQMEASSEQKPTSESTAAANKSIGTGGLATLLQVDESAPLRSGQLVFVPRLPLGQLLEPLSREEEAELAQGLLRSSQSRDSIADPGCSSGVDLAIDNTVVLSLEGYLQVCRANLGFLEGDLLYARALYEAINSHKDLGIPVVQLQERHPVLATLERSFSIDYHIQMLLNFKMVSICNHSNPHRKKKLLRPFGSRLELYTTSCSLDCVCVCVCA